MLTSHRFSSTLGTVTLYLEDEVLIGLDLAGTAGCGGRLMAELARRVGSNGFRAVGTAVGHNPIPIIIPCHRIVRQDGVIGRFGAGNGTETKRQLLRLEGHSV